LEIATRSNCCWLHCCKYLNV